jgi:glycosyltransferase involved in cell wall biosynthesis
MITLITPVRDRAWILPSFLKALHEIDYPKQEINIIFSINDSTDESEEMLQQFINEHKDEYSSMLLIKQDMNLPKDARTEVRQKIYGGLAQIRNGLLRAALKTDCSHIFSVDSDIIVPPNIIKDLLEDNIDCVSAHIYNSPLTTTASNSMMFTNGRYKHFQVPMNQLLEVDLTGAVYLFKRKIIEDRDIRYEYSNIGEDMPFCRRMKERGYKIYTDTRIHCDHVMNKSIYFNNASECKQKYTFIYPPTIKWEKLFQRPQQMMRAFAKLGFESFFCNTSDTKDFSPEKNLYVVQNINSIPDIPGVKKVLWCSHPPSFNRACGTIKHDITIFDALDEPIGEFVSWKQKYEDAQKRANIIFAVSDSLYQYNSQYNVHMLPNGCDFEHFNTKVSAPDDMIKRGRPVVGFYGAVATWLDWNMINYCIQQRPDYDFVFVGPGYGIVLPTNTENSFFLGERDYKDLPGYLHSFDVAIVPFKITNMTLGCDPIKCYEYLASGKPVVSTPIPQIVKMVPAVRIGATKEEFLAQIDDAIAHPGVGKKARIELARNNSWEARALEVIQKLEELK